MALVFPQRKTCKFEKDFVTFTTSGQVVWCHVGRGWCPRELVYDGHVWPGVGIDRRKLTQLLLCINKLPDKSETCNRILLIQ